MLVVRPEDLILTCVGRRSLDPAGAERLRQLLGAELNWEYLLARADQHCLMPLLCFHLNAVPSSLVPQRVISRLKDAAQENTRSSLFLTGELLKVLEFLEGNNIRAIPFKGPMLALQAYGDVGLRQFADLDILIHRSDVLRAKQLLISCGFKPMPELTTAQQAALLRFDCAYNFDNGQGIVLDLHWGFVERHLSFQIDSNGLWDRLEPITIGGRQLLTLSSEDLVLILCLHGFTHFWDRLGWICDIANLIDRQRDIDWELVLKNATRLGMLRILSLGLRLAVELLEAQLPREILTVVLADHEVQKVSEQVQERVFAERGVQDGLFDRAGLFLSMRERTRDKIRCCFSLIATPRIYDWMFLSLPDSLFFLYYLVRPFRLAGKYGRWLKGSHHTDTPITRH